MFTHTFNPRHLLTFAGSLAWHAVAVFVGLALMVIGLALGVTMIMLPVGIVVGLGGLCVLLVGLFAPFRT